MRPIAQLRWDIALLLCLSSILNYLDRQTLSVLAATIQIFWIPKYLQQERGFSLADLGKYAWLVGELGGVRS